MLLTILLIIILFGSSIALHELGHFLAARRGELSVTKFAIGFGPLLWSRKLRNGTNFELRAIPLGGFVQIPDLEQQANLGAVQSIPRRVRFNVFIAGVTFNMLFAFALGTLLWIIGLPASYSYQSTRLGYVVSIMDDHPAPAYVAGLRSGDEILAIDGSEVHSWPDLAEAIVLGTGAKDRSPRVTVTYLHDGQGKPLKTSFTPYVDSEGIRRIGVIPFSPAIVGETVQYSPAARGHIPIGARIITVNSKPVHSIFEFSKFEDEGKPMQIAYNMPDSLPEKTSDDVNTFLNPRSSLYSHLYHVTIMPERPLNHSELQTGILWSSDFDMYIAHNDPVTTVFKAIRTTFRTLHSLFSSHSTIGLKHMSGPVGITTTYYSLGQTDWRYMLWFTLVLNVSLAICNLLPLPILDGGHLFFLAIEALRQRPPSQWMFTAIAKLQSVCATILIIFALYVTYHDITRAATNADQPPYETPKFKPVPENTLNMVPQHVSTSTLA